MGEGRGESRQRRDPQSSPFKGEEVIGRELFEEVGVNVVDPESRIAVPAKRGKINNFKGRVGDLG